MHQCELFAAEIHVLIIHKQFAQKNKAVFCGWEYTIAVAAM
jgi:hypothetical protein